MEEESASHEKKWARRDLKGDYYQKNEHIKWLLFQVVVLKHKETTLVKKNIDVNYKRNVDIWYLLPIVSHIIRQGGPSK